jgi:hypothetical protein
MAITYCPNCRRALSTDTVHRDTMGSERQAVQTLVDEIEAKARLDDSNASGHDDLCPHCGAVLPGSGEGAGHGRRYALAAICVLIVLNVYSVMTREDGPPPEIEALHSAQDAIRQCRENIESSLSDRGGKVQEPLEAEYLQGGEYEVRGTVTIMEGNGRATAPILCEAQFRPERGWRIEYVEVGG